MSDKVFIKSYAKPLAWYIKLLLFFKSYHMSCDYGVKEPSVIFWKVLFGKIYILKEKQTKEGNDE